MIIKIEYYLDGKLVKTVQAAPFSYHLDSTKLLNGRHELIMKTYYDNGIIGSDTQAIDVSNPFGWQQVRLQAGEYPERFVTPGVLLLVLAGWWIFRSRLPRSKIGSGNDSPVS